MKIGPATETDIGEVVTLLGKTFASDPSLGWVLRKARDPQWLLTEFYSIVAREAFTEGNIDVARDGENYLGVAVWLPPGVKLSPPALRQALPLVRQLGAALPTLVRYLRASSSVKLPFPAWYLSVIAVDDSARGRGVGSALLDHGLERAGGEAVKLEATSARAAKLYSTRGFITLGEVKTPAPSPEIIMWRPAGFGLTE